MTKTNAQPPRVPGLSGCRASKLSLSAARCRRELVLSAAVAVIMPRKLNVANMKNTNTAIRCPLPALFERSDVARTESGLVGGASRPTDPPPTDVHRSAVSGPHDSGHVLLSSTATVPVVAERQVDTGDIQARFDQPIDLIAHDRPRVRSGFGVDQRLVPLCHRAGTGWDRGNRCGIRLRRQRGADDGGVVPAYSRTATGTQRAANRVCLATTRVSRSRLQTAVPRAWSAAVRTRVLFFQVRVGHEISPTWARRDITSM